MADRIKGITVVIGGDTSPLAKALTDVNKTISKTQSALKDINKILKVDPTNTVMLTEKQRLLNQQFEDSKQKLNALRQAQEVLNERYKAGKITEDQYREGLLDLKIAIGQTEAAIKDYGTQLLQLQAQQSALYKGGEILQSAGSKLTDLGRSLRIVSVAATGAVTAAVKTSGSFDEAMSQVQATMGILKDEQYKFNGEMASGAEIMDALAAATQKQGATTKYSATEAATALNILALAGYNAEKQIATLPSVLTLAAAGNMDLETAAQAAISSMNVLGISADDLESEIDKMAKTASSSNTNLEELSEAIKVVGGFASMAQIPTDKLYTAIGILADNGVKATKNGTMLRTVIKNLYTPTKKQSDAMEALGLETSDASGNLKDFDDILADLAQRLNGLDEATRIKKLKDLFDTRGVAGAYALLRSTGLEITNITSAINDLDISWENYGLTAETAADEVEKSVRGLNDVTEKAQKLMDDFGMSEDDAAAIAALLTTNVEKAAGRFGELEKKIEDSSGAAKRMKETQIDNLNSALKILRNNTENAGIAFGHALTPTIRNLADSIKNLSQWFINLDPKQQAMIAKMTAITAVSSPLLLALGKITSGIGSLGVETVKVVTDLMNFTTIVDGNAVALSGLGKVVTTLGAAGTGGLAVLAVAIGGAVVATQMLEKSMEDAYAAAEKERFDIDALAESIDAVTKKHDDFAKSKDKVIEASNNQAETSEHLWQQLQKLADASGYVEEKDRDLATFLLGELNNALGTEYTMQNGIIQQYDQMAASIDVLIEKRKAEALLAGLQESYTAALLNRKDAENAVKEAADGVAYTEEKLIKAHQDVQQAQADYNAAMRNGAQDIEAYKIALDNALKAEENAQSAYDATKEKLSDAKSAFEDYEQTIKTYEGLASAVVSGDQVKISDALLLIKNDFKTAKDSTIETLEQQVKEWDKKYNELKRAVDSGSKDVTQAQVNEAKRMRELSVAELEGYDRDLVVSMNKFASDIKTLAPDMTTALTDETEEMLKRHKELIEKIQPQTKESIDKTSSYLMTTAKPQMAADGRNLGDALADSTKSAVEAKEGELQSAIDNTLHNATAPTQDNMYTWGLHYSANLARGIRDNIRLIREAAEDAAEAAAGPLEHTVPKTGPLKDEMTWMPHMMQNLAKGIRDNAYLVTREMLTLAQEIAAAGSISQQKAVNLYVHSDLKLDKRQIAQAVNQELGLMI